MWKFNFLRTKMNSACILRAITFNVLSLPLSLSFFSDPPDALTNISECLPDIHRAGKSTFTTIRAYRRGERVVERMS